MAIPTPKEIQELIKLENARVDWLQHKLELHEVKISLLRQLIQINEQLIAHLNSDPRRMPSPPDLGEYTLPFGYRYGCRHSDHEGCHVHPDGTYWHHPTDAPVCPL